MILLMAVVSWPDGVPLKGHRRRKIIIDNKEGTKGHLLDGRQVDLVKGQWIYCPPGKEVVFT